MEDRLGKSERGEEKQVNLVTKARDDEKVTQTEVEKKYILR